MLVTSCKQDHTTEFVSEISRYSDYSTVTWSDLSEKYYRPNTGDWGEDIEKCICTGFPLEIAHIFGIFYRMHAPIFTKKHYL